VIVFVAFIVIGCQQNKQTTTDEAYFITTTVGWVDILRDSTKVHIVNALQYCQ
jgi:hypothetical protein